MLAYVFAVLALACHVAQLPGAAQEGIKLLLGQTDGVVAPPCGVLVAQAAALHAGTLEVAAALSYHLLQGLDCLIKGLGLDLKIGPADKLGVLVD